MHWGKRLELRRIDLGWTKRELSRRADVPYDNLIKYLAAEVDNPRGDELRRLADAVGMSEPKLRYDVDILTHPSDASNQEQKHLPTTADLRYVPVITLSDAGQVTAVCDPTELDADSNYVVVDRRVSARSFALHINDNSMLPRLEKGELVVCDPEAKIHPGDIVVAKVRDHDDAEIRKYRPQSVGQDEAALFDLVPLNEDYPTISSGPDCPIQLVARVVLRFDWL